MKRIISFVLAFMMFGTVALANITFTDIDASHWGYQNVEKLVNDGTVKGYTDGSFRPDNTVTRAEFVKMMGKGEVSRETAFYDVDASHWGYEYIMTSGFDSADGNFYPDKAITRGEAVTLLWKRFGSKEGLYAPSALTSSNYNKSAVYWAYNYKIMIGDDGLNLRLDDSISRVEAAALIIRTRETDFNKAQANFKDTVSNDVLKAVFDSFDIFDTDVQYEENKTITNGELARAVIRIISGEKNLSYIGFNASSTFEGTYAKDINIVANKCLGKEYDTKEFADKEATVGDAVAMLSYMAIEKSNTPIVPYVSDVVYSDAQSVSGTKRNYLNFAFQQGVFLTCDGKLGVNDKLTHKTLALLLIQFDEITGTKTGYSTLKDSKGNFIKYDISLNKNIATYPANYKEFDCVIEGVENIAYNKPQKAKEEAYKSYSFASEFSSMFIDKISTLPEFIKKNYGIDTEIVMYPSLVWNNGSGFTLRVKCKVLETYGKAIDINEMFGDMLVSDISGNLANGMEIMMEISLSYADLIM